MEQNPYEPQEIVVADDVVGMLRPRPVLGIILALAFYFGIWFVVAALFGLMLAMNNSEEDLQRFLMQYRVLIGLGSFAMMIGLSLGAGYICSRMSRATNLSNALTVALLLFAINLILLRLQLDFVGVRIFLVGMFGLTLAGGKLGQRKRQPVPAEDPPEASP